MPHSGPSGIPPHVGTYLVVVVAVVVVVFVAVVVVPVVTVVVVLVSVVVVAEVVVFVPVIVVTVVVLVVSTHDSHNDGQFLRNCGPLIGCVQRLLLTGHSCGSGAPLQVGVVVVVVVVAVPVAVVVVPVVVDVVHVEHNAGHSKRTWAPKSFERQSSTTKAAQENGSSTPLHRSTNTVVVGVVVAVVVVVEVEVEVDVDVVDVSTHEPHFTGHLALIVLPRTEVNAQTAAL